MYQIKLLIDGGLASVESMKEALAYDLEKYGEVSVTDIELIEDKKKAKLIRGDWILESRVLRMRHRIKNGLRYDRRRGRREKEQMFGQVDLLMRDGVRDNHW